MKSIPLLALLLVFGGALAPADDKPASPPLDEKEQAFADLMKDAVLVGNFTVNRAGKGTKDGGPQVPERYGIKSVTKVQGDQWLVNAQIKYGTIDTTVPVPVKMHWANDTPVLSVTDLSLPLVGSDFGARILFSDGQYAGTWRHGKVGGLMYGRLEKAQPPTKPESDPKPAAEKKPEPATP